MTNPPIAQQVLQEELEAVRNNIYTDRYDMGIEVITISPAVLLFRRKNEALQWYNPKSTVRAQ